MKTNFEVQCYIDHQRNNFALCSVTTTLYSQLIRELKNDCKTRQSIILATV